MAHQSRNEHFDMKFCKGDPSLLGVLSQSNFLQIFKMASFEQSPGVHAANSMADASKVQFYQRDFIKVSEEMWS